MKITATENNDIQLEEVFNSIILKTADDEEMAICMRDTGFEFKYQGEWYFAKEGQVMPFHKSVRGNCLVDQTPQCELLQKIEKVKNFKWGLNHQDNENRMCQLIQLL